MIALVGDYRPEITAHVAILQALALARRALGRDLTWRWVPTTAIGDSARELEEFRAVWLVPASPYENMAGAIAAVRFARETQRPFLGTCGGFQHALIEFARHVAGLTSADHAETNPAGETLVVTPLNCSLVEKSGSIRFSAGSRLRAIYGCDTAVEGYHCNYGVNPAHQAAFARAGLRFTAFEDNGTSEAGEIRGAELPAHTHPFFIGTLFQPERAALRGELPPLVQAFVAAALK